LLAGKAGDRADFAARRPPAQPGRAHIGRDHAVRILFYIAAFRFIDAERAGKIRIEFAGRNRRLTHIALLRRFAEPTRNGRAGTMRAREIGATIE
jgi:hypothetical protein